LVWVHPVWPFLYPVCTVYTRCNTRWTSRVHFVVLKWPIPPMPPSTGPSPHRVVGLAELGHPTMQYLHTSDQAKQSFPFLQFLQQINVASCASGPYKRITYPRPDRAMLRSQSPAACAYVCCPAVRGWERGSCVVVRRLQHPSAVIAAYRARSCGEMHLSLSHSVHSLQVFK
jgi:hypothetical protein